LFVRNERFITLIEMDGGGLVAVVMVAAVGVGHVTVSYDPEVATHRPEFFRAARRHRQYDQPKADCALVTSWASFISARPPSWCSNPVGFSSMR
jgi:phosphatidylserine decarboxylase